MVSPVRPSTGILAPAGFVTGGDFLTTAGFSPSAALPQSTSLFGAGGLLGGKSKEEQAILDAPDEFFVGDTKKEIAESREKALKAVRQRQANESLQAPIAPQQGGAPPGGGLLAPQAEGPGFFERLTRAGSQGGLLDIIGRTAFGAPEIEKLQNQAKREELTAGRRRRTAQQELTGLLTGEGQLDPRQMVGLLSQINPEAVAGLLAGQAFPGAERAKPSIIRTLQEIGIDTTSEEAREIVLNSLKGSDVSDDLIKTVQLQLMALQLETERSKVAQSNETEDKRRRTTGSTLRADLKNIIKLADLNTALEGGALQTGSTFQDIRRSTAEGVNEIMELFDVDRTAARKLVSQRDAFNKLANNFLIGSSSRFGGGTLTDQKLSTLRDSMAGINITPDANRVILADSLDALLDAADIEGITIENAKELRAKADELRSKAGLSPGKDPLLDIPGFSGLPKDEQEELRERLNNAQ